MRVLATLLLAALASPAAADTAPPGARSCTGCHAPGAEAELPLWGLSSGEIEAALSGFREGTREATVMDRIARGFSADESQAIARWLAACAEGPAPCV